MASAVKEWLSGLGLGQYGEAFIDNGYDEMGMCHALNNDDIDAIGVDSPDDRQTILEASKALTEKAAAPGAMYFELEAESQTVEEKNQCAVPVYMELEAEQTVKIPRLRLKIMIREEMKRDDVDLAEEPYSNPDGTPGESLNDLIEVYALQFNTAEEDVQSCVEALRKNIVSSRPSVSSESSQPTSPVQKELPRKPAPPKPTRRPSDSKSATESKKPPPRPSSAPVVGSLQGNEKGKQPPIKPHRTKPSVNVGEYVNIDEIESVPPPLEEQKKSPTPEDKPPKAAPRKPSVDEGGTKEPPKKPSVQKASNAAKEKEDGEGKLEKVNVEDRSTDGNEAGEASREDSLEAPKCASRKSGMRLSVSRSFQGLKAKLRRLKTSSSGSSLSESATPSPAESPPPTSSPPVADIGGLVARDITMSDEERLKLMMMVKEGKCTIDEALSQIQLYELERKEKAEEEEEEPVIRKAETVGEKRQEDEPEEKTKETKRAPPPKPTRPRSHPSPTTPPAVLLENEMEGEKPPQPAARPTAPPRRNKPVKVSPMENEHEEKGTEANGVGEKPVAEETEGQREEPEEAVEEETPAKSTKKDRKSILSGIVFGRKQPATVAPAEKKADEKEGEQATIEVTKEAEQGDIGDEAVGKPGKKGFFKSVLGIGKKDKTKKEQKDGVPTGDSIVVAEEAATTEKTVDETHEQIMAEEVETEAAVEDKPKRSGTILGSLGKLKGKFKKKHRQETKAEDSGPMEGQSDCIAVDAAEVTLNPAMSKESISSAASAGSQESPSTTTESLAVYTGPTIGRARVIQEFVPSAYDTESLTLKVGDVINVVSNPEDGSWTGELNGRVGLFKFIYVEMLEDEPELCADIACSSPATRQKTIRQLPSTLEEFLARVDLQDRRQLFALNGYDSLDIIKKIDRSALDELGINDVQQRKSILTLVKQLNDASLIAVAAPRKKPAPMPPSGGRSPAPAPPKAYRPFPPSRLVQSAIQVSATGETKSRKPAPRPPGDKLINRLSGDRTASPDAQRKQPAKPAPFQPRSGSVDSDVKSSPKPSAKRPAPPAPTTKVSISGGEKRPTPPVSPKASSPVEATGHNDSMRPQPRQRFGTSAESPVRSVVPGDPKPQPRSRSATVASRPPSVTKRPMSGQSSNIVSSANNTQLEAAVAKPVPRQKLVKPTGVTAPMPASKPAPVPAQKPLPAAKPTRVPAAKPAPANQVKPPPYAASKPENAAPPATQTSDGASAGTAVGPVAPVRRKRKPKDSPVNPNTVKKLETDQIDLTESPYSAEDGSCGIPVGLIHRYAEELRLSPQEVAISLEKLRSDELKAAGRQVVPMDPNLAEKDWTKNLETSSVNAFVISIGLPVHIDTFSSQFTDVSEMNKLSSDQVKELGVKDPRHIKRIQTAIAVLKERT